MEHARYRMLAKQKLYSLSLDHPSGGDSWEEQAFAEDAAGLLGGYVWPPRSYSCSFCTREFRSAQALGGHMNVHRRDRARLKQSPIFSPQDDVMEPYLNSRIYNPNPNYNHAVSTPPAQENGKEVSFLPFFSCPIPHQEQLDDHSRSSMISLPLWSSLVADQRYFPISDLNNDEKHTKLVGSNGRAEEDYVRSDLVSLVVRQTHLASSGGEEEEEEAMSYKRRRILHSTTFASFSKSNSDHGKHDHLLSEVLELSSSSKEDHLDLELRL